MQLNRELDRIYERIKQQKELISEQAIQLDYLQAENQHMKDVLEENEQLKERISELKFLLELAKLHTEVAEGKIDKFVELKLND